MEEKSLFDEIAESPGEFASVLGVAFISELPKAVATATAAVVVFWAWNKYVK